MIRCLANKCAIMLLCSSFWIFHICHKLEILIYDAILSDYLLLQPSSLFFPNVLMFLFSLHVKHTQSSLTAVDSLFPGVLDPTLLQSHQSHPPQISEISHFYHHRQSLIHSLHVAHLLFLLCCFLSLLFSFYVSSWHNSMPLQMAFLVLKNVTVSLLCFRKSSSRKLPLFC